jgi:hypothetical protein
LGVCGVEVWVVLFGEQIKRSIGVLEMGEKFEGKAEW